MVVLSVLSKIDIKTEIHIKTKIDWFQSHSDLKASLFYIYGLLLYS